MEKFESKFEQTGDLFEWEAIGQIDTQSLEYQKALREYHKSLDEAAKKGREAYEDAKLGLGLKLIKKCQPYDPTDPPNYLARDLRIELQDLLKLSPKEWDKVKFYTAASKSEPKTPIDKEFGIDAFIEYEETPGEEPCRATLDLTVNPQKKFHKSNLIIHDKDLPDQDLYIKEYNNKIREIAGQVLLKMAVHEVQEKKKIL